MSHIMIVTDDNEIVDITEDVYQIFEDTGRWPTDWEDWVDTETALAICRIGSRLGFEGYAEKTAKYLAEVQAVVERRAAAEAYREKERQLRADREAIREAQAPVVLAYLEAWMLELGARHSEKVAQLEKMKLGGREYVDVPGVGWMIA